MPGRGSPIVIPSARKLHKEIRAEVKDWKKAGPSSILAHKVTKCGSKFFVTVCGVALLKEKAVDATIATMKCVECREKTGAGVADELMQELDWYHQHGYSKFETIKELVFGGMKSKPALQLYETWRTQRGIEP